MAVIRVFPRRTTYTPRDDMAFVGEPPMIRPPADAVHVSCTFTWDKPAAERLAAAWGQYYPVQLGGPAYDSPCQSFTPGQYIKAGVTFTSRGCNYQCPWCLAWRREGPLWEDDNFAAGWIINDNNWLQCGRPHHARVLDMLRTQRNIEFTGGLDVRLMTQGMADELRGLRLKHLFFACDTPAQLKPLQAVGKMFAGIDRRKLRCYVLLAFSGQTISAAVAHLENVWAAGFMPHAQLYQPADRLIVYPQEWHELSRRWIRPAVMQIMNGHDSRLPHNGGV